ncbi:MAG: hypothetical protein P8Y69_11140 [Gammaproteobacteria bacterium]
MRGGASADRLAWVFLSGYQAALNWCFPEFAGPGWRCLASTEPGNATPCELIDADDGHRLRGEKSWIAAADHVDRLVVAVSERFVGADRGQPGLHISVSGTPAFLVELSQGAARFDDVVVEPADILHEPERGRWFRAAEPLFVLLALSAFVTSHSREVSGEEEAIRLARRAMATGADLVDVLKDPDGASAALGELRRHCREAVASFVDNVLPRAADDFRSRWRADARLLEMFRVAPLGGNMRV